MAVYHRSVDTRLGDRGNHAGVGVWLHERKIVDPVAVLRGLYQLGRTLARSGQPEAIVADATGFASAKYLGAYIQPADRLPFDWRGAPATSSALASIAYRFASAPTFDAALGTVGEDVARASLDWSGTRRDPRTLILVTPRGTPPSDRAFEELRPAGTFLADVLEQLPKAFAAERKALRAEASQLAGERSRWKAEHEAQVAQLHSDRRQHEDHLAAERHAQEERWQAERQEWETLDGKPVTPESIAQRLNTISKQLQSMEGVIRAAPARQIAPMPAPPADRAKLARSAPPNPPALPMHPSPRHASWWQGSYFGWIALGVAAAVVLLLGALLWWWQRDTPEGSLQGQDQGAPFTTERSSIGDQNDGRASRSGVDQVGGAGTGQYDTQGASRTGDSSGYLPDDAPRSERELVVVNER